MRACSIVAAAGSDGFQPQAMAQPHGVGTVCPAAIPCAMPEFRFTARWHSGRAVNGAVGGRAG
eukprot:6199034-Pyramimonas_sp.AAC.1